MSAICSPTVFQSCPHLHSIVIGCKHPFFPVVGLICSLLLFISSYVYIGHGRTFYCINMHPHALHPYNSFLDIDLLRYPIVDSLRVLSGDSLLLLGDSLMREVFYSLFWIFPGSSKRPSLLFQLLAEHPQFTCASRANDIDYSIFVSRLNLSVHFCYNTYLGEHLSLPMEKVFLKEHFTYTVMNSGLWYNRFSNLTEGEERKVRSEQPGEDKFRRWVPLSDVAYERDLALLNNQIKMLARKNRQRVSHLLWLESTPQHFRTGTFQPDDFHREGEVECKHFDQEEMEASMWRNRLAHAHLELPMIHVFLPLSELFFSHPWTKDGVPDCTHFCNPG